MAMRPINRIKHIVDSSATLAAATNLPVDLIKSVDAPLLADTEDVVTGSTVNGIFLNVQVASNEAQDIGAVPNVYMAVFKNPGAQISLSPQNLGDDINKRFVIHQEMVMIENTGKGGNVKTLFKGVIVIPKGFRRFAPLDKLQITIRSNALDIAFCLQCIYKEFR